ncbi:MAG: leucyl/phenylalanyl-tRNA--protein transferase [Bacteroidetes bacterium]|nr:MAG: leucyl/phenylalanyl-tRNA--protein transferase [Bacteroidota bacterium]
MPLFSLSDELIFPDPAWAEPDGMLAVGGDLRPERLLLAYQNGIFPWYSRNEPILWWSPDPRFVLYPEQLYVSKSMKQVLKRETFRITFDQKFREVIGHCGKTRRPGQRGTWITHDMLEAYCTLHERGFAHSVEVWENEKLVGGLYGVSLGKAFFGESMFAHVSNASKAGFITLVRNLQERGFQLIDCQVYTEHLESLGAVLVPRERFLEELSEVLKGETWQGNGGEMG